MKIDTRDIKIRKTVVTPKGGLHRNKKAYTRSPKHRTKSFD